MLTNNALPTPCLGLPVETKRGCGFDRDQIGACGIEDVVLLGVPRIWIPTDGSGVAGSIITPRGSFVWTVLNAHYLPHPSRWRAWRSTATGRMENRIQTGFDDLAYSCRIGSRMALRHLDVEVVRYPTPTIIGPERNAIHVGIAGVNCVAVLHRDVVGLARREGKGKFGKATVEVLEALALSGAAQDLSPIHRHARTVIGQNGQLGGVGGGLEVAVEGARFHAVAFVVGRARRLRARGVLDRIDAQLAFVAENRTQGRRRRRGGLGQGRRSEAKDARATKQKGEPRAQGWKRVHESKRVIEKAN